MYQVDGIC